jgi:hypothetical protein
MIPPRCAFLIPLVVLAACGGGSTIRVADEEGDDPEPVSLAPTPDPAAEPSPPPSSETNANPETASADTTPRLEQGYAPYGSANPAAIELRRIGQWTRTGIAEARRLVIRDANAWAEFWSELGVGDRPAVDFSRDLVVAVSAGQRPTGGYEIAISRVSQSDGQLTIEVLETAPGPNCTTTSALTQPVDVVVVPGVAAKGWSFVERNEVRGCR